MAAISKPTKTSRFLGSMAEAQVIREGELDPVIDRLNSIASDSGVISATSATLTSVSATTVAATNVSPTNLTLTTQTLAAAGSTQGDAGVITGQLVFVTGADATKGVKLPAVGNGKFIILINTANAVLKIYPSSGEKIQGGTGDANISLAAYCVCIFGYKAAGDWYTTEITAGAVA